MNEEDMEKKLQILSEADPISAWKLLEALGYDLWLDNVNFINTWSKSCVDKPAWTELLE